MPGDNMPFAGMPGGVPGGFGHRFLGLAGMPHGVTMPIAGMPGFDDAGAIPRLANDAAHHTVVGDAKDDDAKGTYRDGDGDAKAAHPPEPECTHTPAGLMRVTQLGRSA